MVGILRIAALVPLAGALSSTHDVPAKRVAIIGAGAGGASAAYHLAQYAAESSIPVDITVLERNAYIGGRTTTVKAWDDAGSPVELGGSIFVDVNHILVSAMKTFNLSTTDDDDDNISMRSELPDLGIWDGGKFVLVTRQEDGWWEKAKLVWRYGSAPFWTNRLMKKAVGRFLNMYEEPFFPWRSLSEVVERVGLLEMTGVTGEQYLQANGVMGRFAREVVQASTRVNYASNLGYIHGLETMVCMATSGAMSIQGGNWRIFAHMLNSSSSITTHLNTSVLSISKLPNKTYNLTSLNHSNHTTQHSLFDTVILAAPFQFSSLTISPPPKHTPDTIPYTTLHVTLFASPHILSPEFFHLDASAPIPQHVLTTLPEQEAPTADDAASPLPFFSISLVNRFVNPTFAHPRPAERVYKIFSPERIDDRFLSQLLGRNVSLPDDVDTWSESRQDRRRRRLLNNDDDVDDDDDDNDDKNISPVSWIHRKIWSAYPREYPRVTFEEVVLDDGLWYTSGIEGLISTMETSALSGRNVARGVRDEWLAGGEEEEKEEEEKKKKNEQGEL